jgi:hypothetical protein
MKTYEAVPKVFLTLEMIADIFCRRTEKEEKR